MAQGNTKLDAGNSFPQLSFQTLDGTSLTVPINQQEQWTIFLLYRGEW